MAERPTTWHEVVARRVLVSFLGCQAIRTQGNGLTLHHQGRFKLDVRMNILTDRVIRHWNCTGKWWRHFRDKG